MAKSKIAVLDEGDMRPDQVRIIARQLGVTQTDVVDMNRRLGGDVSLNSPLREALSVLNERERRIFETRRLADDTITLEDLAAEFGVSRERVRQIEVRAFEKVQRAVKNRIAAMEARPSAPALQVH